LNSYLINKDFKFHYPCDGFGIAAFDKKSHNTFFVNIPNKGCQELFYNNQVSRDELECVLERSGSKSLANDITKQLLLSKILIKQ
jgi:hypothetical protein